jgi:hypothetical protein
MSCPSALIGHPEGSAKGFPLKDCGNDGEGLSFLQAAKLLRKNYHGRKVFSSVIRLQSGRLRYDMLFLDYSVTPLFEASS